MDSDQPTIRVRHGKGGRSRIVRVHPDLLNTPVSVLQFADAGRGKVIGVSRCTALRWMQEVTSRAVELGALAAGRCVGAYTFRHSHTRLCFFTGSR